MDGPPAISRDLYITPVRQNISGCNLGMTRAQLGVALLALKEFSFPCL
jgi:hypothetical protein